MSQETQEELKTKVVEITERVAEEVLQGRVNGIFVVLTRPNGDVHFEAAGLRKTDALGLLHYAMNSVVRSLG